MIIIILQQVNGQQERSSSLSIALHGLFGMTKQGFAHDQGGTVILGHQGVHQQKVVGGVIGSNVVTAVGWTRGFTVTVMTTCMIVNIVQEGAHDVPPDVAFVLPMSFSSQMMVLLLLLKMPLQRIKNELQRRVTLSIP